MQKMMLLLRGHDEAAGEVILAHELVIRHSTAVCGHR
jgi:hypothetical protein